MPTDLTLVDELDNPDSLIGRDTALSLENGAAQIGVDDYELNGANSLAILDSEGIESGSFYRYSYEVYDTPSNGIRLLMYGDNNTVTFPEGESFRNNGVYSGMVRLSTGSGTGSFSNRFTLQGGSDTGLVRRVRNIRLDRVTDGILTNFPAAQPWVPVLGTNQAYLSGFTGGNFVSGVNVSENQLTSTPTGGIQGSFGISSERIIEG